MRGFVAFQLPPALLGSLDARLARVQRQFPAWRWVPPRNLHVTLVFLGALRESMRRELGEALAGVCSAASPLRLRLAGGGVFPARGAARAAWLGLEASQPLTTLQRELAAACRELGYAVEDRPYTAHLTVARCRATAGPAVREIWQSTCGEVTAGLGAAATFAVACVGLFESIPQPQGVQYRVVKSYPLSETTR